MNTLICHSCCSVGGPGRRRLAVRRHRSPGRIVVAAALAGLALAGCGTPPPSLAELNASYGEALARTAPEAARFEPDSAAEQAALGRVQAYFDGLTPEKVRDRTLEVYAQAAYLNDTLVGISGAEQIRDYFAATMDRADRLEVRFLDLARSGTDYYVRWEMTVQAPGLAGGEPVVSLGVTHFRFDAEGRVLIHKDYWDSGTGLYEHLPVLGGLVKRVRGAAHAE